MSPSPNITFSNILLILRQKADLCDMCKDCLFVIDGRTALQIAISLLSKSRTARKWLIPAYFCPSVHQAFIDAKVPFEFYPIREDLQANSEYLYDKLLNDKSVGGILFINYFGFKTDTKSYEPIIKENSISVIYDCAHMLLPNSEDTIRNENEAYVYSMRKWYPIPHGGALFYKNLSAEKLVLSKCSDSKLYRQLFKYLVYNIEQCLGFEFRKYLLSFESISKYLEQGDVAECYDQLMHDKVIAYFKLKMLSKDIIWQKHRNNFQYFADYFRGNDKYVPIFSKLDDTKCPFVFPLIVKTGNRDDILKKCFRNKISLRVYWRFISNVIPKNDLFEFSYNLSNNILCLPIHYEMTAVHLEKICETIFCSS